MNDGPRARFIGPNVVRAVAAVASLEFIANTVFSALDGRASHATGWFLTAVATFLLVLALENAKGFGGDE